MRIKIEAFRLVGYHAGKINFPGSTKPTARRNPCITNMKADSTQNRKKPTTRAKENKRHTCGPKKARAFLYWLNFWAKKLISVWGLLKSRLEQRSLVKHLLNRKIVYFQNVPGLAKAGK